MAKSYAQMADEIMNSTGMLSESGPAEVHTPSVHGEKPLPELSNAQRNMFLGEANARIVAKKAMKNTLTGNETEREKRGGQAKINRSVTKQNKIGLDSAAKLYDSLGLTSEEAAILQEAHRIMQRVLNERYSDDDIDNIMNTAANNKFGKDSEQAKAHRSGKRNIGRTTPDSAAAVAKAKRDAAKAAGGGTTTSGTGTQSTGTENSAQLPHMREMTAVGGIGMGGSANKRYFKNAPPMGGDTPPIDGVDSSLKKLDKKGKKGKKGKKKKVEVKKESFEYLLGSVLNDAQKKGWIQGAEDDIEKRGTEGVCTGDKFGSASCPPGSKRYNLAKTFKKMGKKKGAK